MPRAGVGPHGRHDTAANGTDTMNRWSPAWRLTLRDTLLANQPSTLTFPRSRTSRHEALGRRRHLHSDGCTPGHLHFVAGLSHVHPSSSSRFRADAAPLPAAAQFQAHSVLGRVATNQRSRSASHALEAGSLTAADRGCMGHSHRASFPQANCLKPSDVERVHSGKTKEVETGDDATMASHPATVVSIAGSAPLRLRSRTVRVMGGAVKWAASGCGARTHPRCRPPIAPAPRQDRRGDGGHVAALARGPQVRAVWTPRGLHAMGRSC